MEERRGTAGRCPATPRDRPEGAAAQESFKTILDAAEAGADERLKREAQDNALSRDERNTRWEALFFEEIRSRAKAHAAEVKRR